MARSTYNVVSTGRTSRTTTFNTVQSYTVSNRSATSTTASSEYVPLNTLIVDPHPTTAKKGAWYLYVFDNPVGSYFKLTTPTQPYTFTAVDDSTPLTAASATITPNVEQSVSQISVSSAPNHGETFRIIDAEGRATTFTFDTGSTSATGTTIGLSGASTATAMATRIATCVNSEAIEITATASSSFVTLKQDNYGKFGDTSVTTSGSTSLASGYTITNFHGGLGLDRAMHGQTISFTDAVGAGYNSTIDAGTQATLPIKLVSVSNIASSTAASGTITVSDYSSITTSTAASAVIAVTSANITAGDTIDLIDSHNVKHTFTAVDVVGDITSEFLIDTSSSNNTAASLKNCIDTNISFSASVSTNQVTVTQAAGGTAGNTTITVTDLAGSAGLAISSQFASGADGTKITVTDAQGQAYNLLADSTVTSGVVSATTAFPRATGNSLVFKKGSSNSDTATNIKNVLSAIGSLTTTVSNNVVTIVQKTNGTSGNVTITENSSGISATGFAGGTAGDAFTLTTKNSYSTVLRAGEDFFVSSASRETTRNSLIIAINNDPVLKANFSAKSDDCELGTLILTANRGGTADNSNSVSFSSTTTSAGDVIVQGTAITSSRAISAQSFASGADSASTSATVIGVSSTTTPAALLTAINSSFTAAISAGLGVSSSASSTAITLTMTTSGTVGNNELAGTYPTGYNASSTGFTGGADNVYIGSNITDYATNLAARINSSLSTVVTASVGASTTLSTARHPASGKVTFVSTTLSDYNSQTITIAGLEKTRTYQFSDECGDNGTLSGSNVMVYLGNTVNTGSVTADGLAEQFVGALNHANGHGYNIRAKAGTTGVLLLSLKHGTPDSISAMSKTASDSVMTKEDLAQPTVIPITITMRTAGDFKDAYPASISLDDSLFLDKTPSTSCVTCDDEIENHYESGPLGGEDASIIYFENIQGGENSDTSDYLNPDWQSFYDSGSAVNSSGLLNDILVNRNGIYEHPTFKQYGKYDGKLPLGGNYHGWSPLDYEPLPQQIGDDQGTIAYEVPGGGNSTVDLDGDNDGSADNEGEGELKLIGDGYIFPPIARLTGLPHLQAKKMQMFYEPALEDRHKPITYTFSGDETSPSSVAVGRQTLFNGVHFFSNKFVNNAYDLLDGDARETQAGSLKKAHLYDLFKAAHGAGARAFRFRERVFPKELNSRRKQLNKRPDYHEVEGVTSSDGNMVETVPDLDQGKRLSDLRNFWRDEQVDRIRNIRKKFDGTELYITPTGSLNSVYDRPPLTKDGTNHEIRQASHGFYAATPYIKAPGQLQTDQDKHHIAAGLSTFYQQGYHPFSSPSPVPANYIQENGEKYTGSLILPPEDPTPTQITSSVIKASFLPVPTQVGIGLPLGQGVVTTFTVTASSYIDDAGDSQQNSVAIGRETHYHQPFDFSLISTWPLDFPEYLRQPTVLSKPLPSNQSGLIEHNDPLGDGPFVMGVQRVGLAPDRIAPREHMPDFYAAYKDDPTIAIKSFYHPYANRLGDPDAFTDGQNPECQVTGAAGELLFSTKPTITLYNKHAYRRPLPFPSNALLPGGKSFYIKDPMEDGEVNVPSADLSASYDYVLNGAEFSDPPHVENSNGVLISKNFGIVSTAIAEEARSGSYEPKPLSTSYPPAKNLGAAALEDADGVIPNVAGGYKLDYESIHHASFLRDGTNTVALTFVDQTVYKFDKPIENYYSLERAAESVSGYASATASMQFLRHAWPYYQPIWNLDKLTGRAPFHDSYGAFVSDINVIARDYSELAEFTISDHFEHYDDILFDCIHNSRPVYSITEFNRIKRNIDRKVNHADNFAKIIGSSNVIEGLKGAGKGVALLSDKPQSAYTASAISSSSPMSSSLHDLEYADYTVVKNSLEASDHEKAHGHWKMDEQSTAFMPKYMQADASENFAKLCRQNDGGFANDENTVPNKITLTVKAIKKLLPQKEMYPIYRTMKLGSLLLDAFSGSIDYSTKQYEGINSGVTDSHKAAAATQSFLEPLFAPGILYNSIKSGLGVSYPIFAGSSNAPYYYGNPHLHGPWGPSPFPSPGNKNSGFDNLSQRIDDPKTMFSYGLANSAGVNRTAPTYLMRKPRYQLPFEAIYRPDYLEVMKKYRVYMTDDLFDQQRSTYVTGVFNQGEYDAKRPGKTHEWTFATASVEYVVTGALAHTTMTGSRFEIVWYHPQSGEKTGAATGYGANESPNWSTKNHPQSALDPSIALWPEINNQTGTISDMTPAPNASFPVLQLHRFEGVSNDTDPTSLTGSQFLIGTNPHEYAVNLAGAINRRCAYTASVVTGSDGLYDIDGNATSESLKSTIHQFFTASAQIDTTGKYGQPEGESVTALKVHTAGPLMNHGIKEALAFFVGDTFVKYDGDNWSPLVLCHEMRLDSTCILGTPICHTSSHGRKFTNSAVAPGINRHSTALMDRPGGSYPRNIAQHEFKPHIRMNDTPEFVTSFSRRLYESSVNNFLAETINFFIEPQTEGRYYDLKLPVVVSEPVRTITVEKDTVYYMSVNLYMRDSHVMCEGPRFSNMPHSAQNASSSMRGAFFGPPMEVVHRDSKMNGPTSGGYTTEAEAMSANLTDPAYHHVTPPYFYGPSSILMRYQATSSGKVSIDDLWSSTKSSSLYFEEYVTNIADGTTASIGDSVPVSDLFFPTSSLSPKVPTKSSVSHGSAARMKLEECVNIWSPDGLIEVLPVDPQNNTPDSASPTKIWTMAPKWICPVLDFGLPATIFESASSYDVYNTKIFDIASEDNGFVDPGIKATTSYYNMLTGRSMWLGYGVDPYDQKALKRLETYMVKQGAALDKLKDYYKAQTKDKLLNGNIEKPPIAYVVEPNQDAKSIYRKGIYLQISETFPEELATQVAESVTFETPYEGAENASGYYTNREEVFSSTSPTGSLTSLLGFENSNPRPIGKMATKKTISEAIVAIPYFEKPFGIFGKVTDSRGPVVLKKDLAEILDKDPSESMLRALMSTTEIMPGYHFLALDSLVFDNILNTILIDHLTPVGSDRNNELRSKYKNYSSALQVADQTDTGKMINTLIGRDGPSKLGYMLPPEIDFINNAGVNAFQMGVIPVSHDLDKKDLMNIWQNLMPDISTKLIKTINEVSFSPAMNYISDAESVHDLLTVSKTGGSLPTPGLSFTSPGQFLNTSILSKTVQNDLGDSLVYYNEPFIPSNSSDFFHKMKWLVFKVKQRAAQDYDSYRKRQIDTAIAEKGYQRKQQQNLQYSSLDCLSTKELYGANWPYDFFSLLERAKIEIEYEVQS